MWHPDRLWKICMSEGEKKEIEAIFMELYFWYIQFESIEIFVTLDIVQRSLWIVQIFLFSDFDTFISKCILENISNNMF